MKNPNQIPTQACQINGGLHFGQVSAPSAHFWRTCLDLLRLACLVSDGFGQHALPSRAMASRKLNLNHYVICYLWTLKNPDNQPTTMLMICSSACFVSSICLLLSLGNLDDVRRRVLCCRWTMDCKIMNNDDLSSLMTRYRPQSRGIRWVPWEAVPNASSNLSGGKCETAECTGHAQEPLLNESPCLNFLKAWLPTTLL
jgi:hypothetical protein